MIYKLTIGDPWDFIGAHGENQIFGEIIRRIDDKHLLFESDEEVSLKGVKSRYWLLSTRYVGQRFNEDHFTGTVTGGILTHLPNEFDDIMTIEKDAVFAIIGGIRPE